MLCRLTSVRNKDTNDSIGEMNGNNLLTVGICQMLYILWHLIFPKDPQGFSHFTDVKIETQKGNLPKSDSQKVPGPGLKVCTTPTGTWDPNPLPINREDAEQA